MINGEELEYMAPADTAKLIRKQLKEQWPGYKFSVRTKEYSGGASIDIEWKDGPTEDDVEAVVKVYEGKDFDSMIDMGCPQYNWLLPDGSTQRAFSPGTEGSMGTIAGYRYPKPCPEAKLVRFSADYVFCQRHYSSVVLQKVSAVTATVWHLPIPLVSVTPDGYAYLDILGGGDAGGRTLNHRIYEALRELSFPVPVKGA